MSAGPPVLQIDEELGLVRYCSGCDEWWPNDDEFWRPGYESSRAVCRACADEGRRTSSNAASTRYRAKLMSQRAS